MNSKNSLWPIVINSFKNQTNVKVIISEQCPNKDKRQTSHATNATTQVITQEIVQIRTEQFKHEIPVIVFFW